MMNISYIWFVSIGSRCIYKYVNTIILVAAWICRRQCIFFAFIDMCATQYDKKLEGTYQSCLLKGDSCTV